MLVEAEIWNIVQTDQGPAVIVRPKDGEVAVPIFIDQLQAHSLLIGMGNATMSRPMTHDLMMTIFEKMGISIERVEITTINATTFYSQIVLLRGGERTSFDARPSDSLSMAVRQGCPIFIAESVVDSAGVPLSAFIQTDEEPAEEAVEGGRTLEDERGRLEKELVKAVEEENYELAAEIRDKLAALTDKPNQDEDRDPEHNG